MIYISYIYIYTLVYIYLYICIYICIYVYIHKRVKGNSVPWITPEIKCMMRNRDYHKKYAIKHSSQPHWESFQFLRNKVNVGMRNAKSKYFHDKITDCSDLEIN